MKIIPYVITAGAIVVLAAGCATSPHTASSIAPATTPSTLLTQSQLKIISAVYGSGRTFTDVTARVNTLLNQSPNGFRARPGRMLVDPTPDATKILVIVYEYKGQQHTLTKGQRGKVSIQILEEAATSKTT